MGMPESPVGVTFEAGVGALSSPQAHFSWGRNNWRGSDASMLTYSLTSLLGKNIQHSAVAGICGLLCTDFFEIFWLELSSTQAAYIHCKKIKGLATRRCPAPLYALGHGLQSARQSRFLRTDRGAHEGNQDLSNQKLRTTGVSPWVSTCYENQHRYREKSHASRQGGRS